MQFAQNLRYTQTFQPVRNHLPEQHALAPSSAANLYREAYRQMFETCAVQNAYNFDPEMMRSALRHVGAETPVAGQAQSQRPLRFVCPSAAKTAPPKPNVHPNALQPLEAHLDPQLCRSLLQCSDAFTTLARATTSRIATGPGYVWDIWPQTQGHAPGILPLTHHISHFETLAKLALLHGALESNGQNFDGYLRVLLSLLRLGDDLQRTAGLYGVDRGCAVQQFTSSALAHAINHYPLSASQLRELDDNLARLEAVHTDLEHARSTEFMLDTIDLLGHYEDLKIPESWRAPRKDLATALSETLWYAPDLEAYLAFHEAVAKALPLPFLQRQQRLGQARRLVQSQHNLEDFSLHYREVDAGVQVQKMRWRALRILIAIQQYQHQHKRAPSGLSALQLPREFLRDPFTDQGLGWRKTSEGFVIASPAFFRRATAPWLGQDVRKSLALPAPKPVPP